MKKNPKTLYLIDGHALCYRAFYAIKELSNSKGMPTNAIYGVITMLKKILNKYSPEMIAFAFDSKGKTVRHNKYDKYKIQRKPMPDDLSVQISKIIEVVKAYNIPIFQIEGYEADDILATLAKKAETKGMDVTIVTGDKDALQLVNDKIKVLSPMGSEDKIYGINEVVKKYGVPPVLLTELMALIGDSSDNIPGVKGIGPVTAEKLINKFGSLSAVFEGLESLDNDNLKEKLRNGRQIAELSYDLIKLDLDIPLEFDIDRTVISEADNEKLISLFREFEFDKFLKELVSSDEEKGKYSMLSDYKKQKKLFELIGKKKFFSFSIAIDENRKVYGFALSVEPQKSYFISLEDNSVFPEDLKKIFDDSSINKISYDMKQNIHIMKEYGLKTKKTDFDVMLADYIIDPSKLHYDLNSIAMRSLGYNMACRDSLNWEDSGQGSMDFEKKINFESACEESDIILRLYQVLYPLLKEKEMMSLFEDVEIPLTEVLADMENNGVGIDVDYINLKSSELDKDLDALISNIYEKAGEEFNINSTKQLQQILFQKLKLPVIKKNKTGVSTNEFVLKKLSTMHELPNLLLNFRELNKLKTGYYDSIKNLVTQDGRLHANFNQAVTATGRLSSSDPNLQNIPIKTKRGREIRKAFVPTEKDKMLIAADYSQIELRVLAELSSDKALKSAFAEGKDVHTFTASLIYDCALEDVSSQMRSIAKTVNFGIVYGISSFGLSKDLDISVKDAQDFIEAYFERYKDVKTFIDKTIKTTQKTGYVTTLLNRRRYIPGINSKNERVKGFAERIAVNTPVQGSAADLIKLAMLRCFEEFKSSEVKMLIQVHDELVFEVPENKILESSLRIKEIMENVIKLDVPLKVDIESGKNWLELKVMNI